MSTKMCIRDRPKEGEKFTGLDFKVNVLNSVELFVVFNVAARNVFKRKRYGHLDVYKRQVF